MKNIGALRKTRILEITKGIVAIVFAFIALLFPEAGLVTLAILFGIELIIVHVSRLFYDIRTVTPQKRFRETNVSLDSVAIALGILLLIAPELFIRILIIPIVIGLFVFGAGRIAIGGFEEGLSQKRRGLTITIGLIMIILGIAIIILPKVALYLLAFALFAAFLLLGIESIISGISGKQKVPRPRKSSTPESAELGPEHLKIVQRRSRIFGAIEESFGGLRSRMEKAKSIPPQKTKQTEKKVLSLDQIRNIVQRSYQYVALYNLINKCAVDETNPANAGGWNKIRLDAKKIDHSFKTFSRPDNDTLCLMAMLDLRKEPVILKFPSFESKYVSLEITGFDHYCRVPLSSKKGDFQKPNNLLFYTRRTNYEGQSVDGINYYVQTDCDFTIILLRILPNSNETKVLEENQVQMKKVELQILAQLQDKPENIMAIEELPVFGKTNEETFGTNLLEVMQFIMNHTTFDPSVEMDHALLAAYEPLGVVPGKVSTEKTYTVNGNLFREVARQLVEEAKTKLRDAEAHERIVPQLFGSKGKIDLETEFVQSVIGPVGLPADQAMYFSLLTKNGKTVNAMHDYIVHIGRDELPPAKALWSLTLYDLKNGFFISNDKKKYSVSENGVMRMNADGGFDIYLSSHKPVGVPEENWLPINRENIDLDVLMRVYVPDFERIKTGWKPPTVEMVS
jgi:uncharacterized membrane protein HdeD (DUF308 family)